MVSQFMHSLVQEYFDVVYSVMGYLKGTLGNRLLFENHGHLQVEVFIDADWPRNVIDKKSTSNYYSFVRGNLVA